MQKTLLKILLLCLVIVVAVPMLAQSPSPATTDVVTADDVNAIAKKLYCPVCENIPLDTCGTAACEDWRYEIRIQLEAGSTEPEIISDFIARFGERVVGTPQDPLLRALALVTPWLIVLAAGIAVIYSLLQWNQPQPPVTKTQEVSDDAYRDLLEKDLSG